jgi:hypothetical protein
LRRFRRRAARRKTFHDSAQGRTAERPEKGLCVDDVPRGVAHLIKVRTAIRYGEEIAPAWSRTPGTDRARPMLP